MPMVLHYPWDMEATHSPDSRQGTMPDNFTPQEALEHFRALTGIQVSRDEMDRALEGQWIPLPDTSDADLFYAVTCYAEALRGRNQAVAWDNELLRVSEGVSPGEAGLLTQKQMVARFEEFDHVLKSLEAAAVAAGRDNRSYVEPVLGGKQSDPLPLTLEVETQALQVQLRKVMGLLYAGRAQQSHLGMLNSKGKKRAGNTPTSIARKVLVERLLTIRKGAFRGLCTGAELWSNPEYQDEEIQPVAKRSEDEVINLAESIAGMHRPLSPQESSEEVYIRGFELALEKIELRNTWLQRRLQREYRAKAWLTYREIALFLIALGVESGKSKQDEIGGGIEMVAERIRKDVERLKKDRKGRKE